MDPVTMTYYATVCAALSAGSGRLPNVALRVLAGVLVGLIAAALLPSFRALTGF